MTEVHDSQPLLLHAIPMTHMPTSPPAVVSYACGRCGDTGLRVIVYRLQQGAWQDRLLCGPCITSIGPAAHLHPAGDRPPPDSPPP